MTFVTARSRARRCVIPKGHAAAIPPAGQVAVFRALPGLGDFLCVVPALRAIKAGRPGAHVTYVGLEASRALAERYRSYVDDFVAFPGFPGLPERRPDVAALPAFLAGMQARRFDLAINFHGSGGITNPLIALFAARRIAAYHRPGEWCPDASLSLPYRDGAAEVRRWLRLTAVLGLPSDDERLELAPAAGGAVQSLDALVGVPDPIVVVHPGAAGPSRRWPARHFAEVADVLLAAGASVVLTGSDSERAVTRAVRSAIRRPGTVVDLAGSTDLDDLAALLRRATLLVSNDTGVSHLAAALRTPSVVVFVDSELERWAPLDRTLHRPLPADPAKVIAEAARAFRAHRSRRRPTPSGDTTRAA